MIILILELSDINRVGYKNCIVQNEDMVMVDISNPMIAGFFLPLGDFRHTSLVSTRLMRKTTESYIIVNNYPH